MNRLTASALVAVIVLPPLAMLSEEATAFDFRNTFQNQTTFGKPDKNTGDDNASVVIFANSITSELSMPVSDNWQAFGRVKLYTESKDKLEPGEPNDSLVRSDVSSRYFFSDNTDIELRELYLDGYLSLRGRGDVFLRAGKQQVVWGQADGFRVLDVINPMNFREFILEDSEDRRIPTWMLNVELPMGDWTAQVLWIPDTTYDQFPSLAQQALFAPNSPRFVPEAPNGVTFASTEVHKPDRIVSDSDAGLRFTSFVSDWDVSVNYLYHYLDRAAPYQSLQGNSFTTNPQYERSHLIGGTFSNAFSDFTVRGEIALQSDQFFINTNLNRHSDGIVSSAAIDTVFGLDYGGLSDTLISGQIFISHIVDYEQKTTRDRNDLTTTLLVEHKLFNQTLTLSGQWMHNINDGDGLASLAIEHQWRSHITVNAGVDIFYGDEIGVFGQYDQRDQFSIGLVIDF